MRIDDSNCESLGVGSVDDEQVVAGVRRVAVEGFLEVEDPVEEGVHGFQVGIHSEGLEAQLVELSVARIVYGSDTRS